ncbi:MULTISPECIES: hypothetical protein [Nocardia]|uniref:hypothetical protein n=1 Tax=Nocardia TaxID=1817 RepID=UPI0003098F94|nr:MULTISPECIES: hypothetical protein [Nocardia]
MPAVTALRAAIGIGDLGKVYIVPEFRSPRLVAGRRSPAAVTRSPCGVATVVRNPLASADVKGDTGWALLGSVLVLAIGARHSLMPFGALGRPLRPT